MKKTLKSVLVLIAVAALGVVAAQAQSHTMLKANVPFDFSIGDKSFASGEYTVNYLDREVQSWSDASGSGKMLFITRPIEVTNGPVDPKLVFYCKSGDCTLAQVWTPYAGHEVRLSKSQQRIAKATDHKIIAVALTSAR